MANLHFDSFPYITTNRLNLREIDLGDEHEIFTLLSNKNVAKFFERPFAKSPQDAREFIKKVKVGIDAEEWIIWGISLKKDRKLIGTISLWNVSHSDNRAEISYELLTEYQNMGYMKETILAIINYGFNNMGLRIIEARTKKTNIKSLNVLRKCDFKEHKPKLKEIDPLGWDNPEAVIYRLYKK